ncbi:MAG: hypothetical protein LBF71_02495, partial [Campylobacteraceae bacterium]|nr:hypothetical protein [Campylobacteraceae bacterium]
MILIYDFIYQANNGVLENFLEDIAKDIKHYITKEGEKISLHVQADEEELKSFSDTLSQTLPFSLFLKEANARVCTQWEELKAIKIPACETALPFTQKALLKAKAEFNPFVKNEVGINPDICPPLIFKDKDCRYDGDFKEAFLKAAKVVESGGYLNIKSKNGYISLSKLRDKKYENFSVMPTDLSAASKIVVLKNTEISALASLEKPLIKVYSNMVFAAKYPNFSRFFNIGLANDLFLYLLGNILFEMGVEFVVIEEKHSAPDAALYFEGEINQNERLQICALDNGQNIILKGGSFASQKLLNSIKTLKNPHHMQFAASMQELDLFEEANCGIYLSLKNDDMIMFYGAQTGVLDMINIAYENSL